jgi:hypothetical protein
MNVDDLEWKSSRLATLKSMDHMSMTLWCTYVWECGLGRLVRKYTEKVWSVQDFNKGCDRWSGVWHPFYLIWFCTTHCRGCA